MNETANRELGQAPVGKLMSQFAIPCIMSLLVSALYNIVDQIFVGRGVGYLGNGATNVVFPVTVIRDVLKEMLHTVQHFMRAHKREDFSHAGQE